VCRIETVVGGVVVAAQLRIANKTGRYLSMGWVLTSRQVDYSG
jgi:hypothetical protein